MTPEFFASAQEWRRWLVAHHQTEPECLVGFIKASTGAANMTWSESVDQALCFGWIDGVRRGIDERSYSIRFTPRKPTSIWSSINVAKMERLAAAGLVLPAGEEAFAQRTERKTAIYSYEREPSSLSVAEAAAFQADPVAWAYFTGQAPSYQRSAIHWVLGAKRAETRTRRLAQLIADSAQGQRLRQYRW
jgi:uncharacterized protein YdeI (YjbR/CyaY-like superfamily)